MLKNITLSADAELIRQARDKARQEKTTLNETFRLWLARYTKAGRNVTEYDSIMEKLNYAQPGRCFNREDMNER
ncbi:MAG: hypothetical protein C0399_10020 [Syntrophus sp. (in: bacteria)]|nr:hypothetical protein [Syntrophus sp. (in: bacteria)]MBA4418582.1 hypothetical protein [Syntrophus sp. (in: bacteria)]